MTGFNWPEPLQKKHLPRGIGFWWFPWFFERFQFFTKMYFRECPGILILYECNRSKPLESVTPHRTNLATRSEFLKQTYKTMVGQEETSNHHNLMYILRFSRFFPTQTPSPIIFQLIWASTTMPVSFYRLSISGREKLKASFVFIKITRKGKISG